MLGVAVHWTVTPARTNHDQCEADWAGVIAQHARQGYNPAPAYNWGVCPHGIRMTGRTWARKSAANGTTAANRDYWAIVALNAPGDTPTPALEATLAALIDEAPDCETRNVRPHSDFFATQCCGDELRAWVASGAMAPGPPNQSPPGPKEFDVFKMHSPSRAAVVTLDEVYTCAFDGTQPFINVDEATFDYIVNDVRAKYTQGRAVRL
jgi:hypothetical protein